MTTIADTLRKLFNTKEEIRQAIIEQGIEVPSEELLETYPEYIRRIAGGGSGGGTVTGDGTLADLKRALATDNPAEYYPIGYEFEDEWNGQSNPLIIAQYLDSSNNSPYGRAEGVICIRKYADLAGTAFGSSPAYSTSTLKSFLDTSYLDSCSKELKAVISPITVPCAGGDVAGTWFLMSDYEVTTSAIQGVTEGIMWQVWKNRAGAGVALPNNDANSGRIVYDANGTPANIWLRTKGNALNNNVTYLWTGGRSSQALCTQSQNMSVLPACFIAKSITPSPEPSVPDVPESVSDIKLMLNAGKDLPIGTEIPDTWNGTSNPLIVGHNTIINGKKAVGLFRKYIEPTAQAFGADNLYQGSQILAYLNGDYLNKCSDMLKGNIGNVSVKWHNGSAVVDVDGKWHLFSGVEVMATYNTGEGEQWEYWKTQTGLSSANNNANSGRKRSGRDNQALYWWLRSRFDIKSATAVITATGGAGGNAPTTQYGILPMCYILAD